MVDSQSLTNTANDHTRIPILFYTLLADITSVGKLVDTGYAKTYNLFTTYSCTVTKITSSGRRSGIVEPLQGCDFAACRRPSAAETAGLTTDNQ